MRPAALLLALVAVRVWAAPAYVSDELVLNVFAETNNQGQRLATLHSGATVDTLSVEGEFTQVRLGDGITGWVRSTYLTAKEPAVLRVQHLEEELERMRVTPAGQADVAVRNERDQLRQTLRDTQQQLTARAETPRTAASTSTAITPVAPHEWLPWMVAGLAAGLGFWAGYATLARRVRLRFGGIKVY